MITKKMIKEHILNQEYGEIINLAKEKHNRVLKFVQMNLFGEFNSPLKWYTIETIGVLAKEFASKDYELYRNLIRRFLWAMNDESGNVPWSSAEGIGVVIKNKPDVFGEFTPMLVTNALDNFICFPGLLWASKEIADVDSNLIKPFIDKLTPFLEHDDKQLVAYSILLVEKLGMKEYLPKLEELLTCREKVEIYDNSKLTEVKIADLSKKVIEKMK